MSLIHRPHPDHAVALRDVGLLVAALALSLLAAERATRAPGRSAHDDAHAS